MSFQDLPVCIFLFSGVILSIISKKLTVTGAITGGLVGLLIYKGAGLTGIAMLAAFFLCGSFATGWNIKKKMVLGIAEKNKGQRTAGQVIANGGLAGLLGGIAWFRSEQSAILQLMMAGSLASAMADTLSSELGSIYGRRFYDILSFKQTGAGPDGIISLEGTLIGIAGAALIAIIYSIGFGLNYYVFIIILAGAVGNFTDSLLGAALERKKKIGNNAVNFLNTCTGAGMCWLLHLLFKK